MTSSISNISLSQSLYQTGSHNTSIDQLLSAALNNGNSLGESLDDGATVKEHLNALFDLAKSNHDESIELLQNLAAGKGAIASYVQEQLYDILIQSNSKSYDVAKKVRQGCQALITQFSSGIVTDELLRNSPKLILVAASKIKGESPHLDTIPPLVKERVEKFNSQEIKPQWWLDNKPKDGVFSPFTTLDEVVEKDYLVQKYRLPEDGACFFRAYLAITDGNSWVTDKREKLFKHINTDKDLKATVLKSIKSGVEGLTNIMPVPDRFKGFFKKDSNEYTSQIFNATMPKFTLYSAAGLRAAILGKYNNTSVSSEQRRNENEFLAILADTIYNNLISDLKVPMNSNEATNKAYAELDLNKVHYNVIGPLGFMNSSV